MLNVQLISEFDSIIERIGHLSPSKQAEYIADYIDGVEAYLLTLPQAPVAMGHILEDGLYVRIARVPAGTMMTGAAHKKACLTVALEGDISVLTAQDGAKRIVAPAMFMATAGVRRLGYCHTDVVWATVHGVQAGNLDDIEAELFSF